MFGKKEKPHTVKSKLKEHEDGTMTVEIAFSPAKHGHDLGAERNYDLKAYQDMVESKSTQTRIKNGYSLGYYSHHSRDKAKGYTPSERDAEGNIVFPVCKTLSMTWDSQNQEVIHTQRILNNPIGKEVQTLIKNAVGGFSSVHDLTEGKFLGFDYVVAPNFSSNRVLVDNLCKDGLCDIDLDSIQSTTEKSVKEEIRNYLDDIGVDSIKVENALYSLETFEDNSQSLLDSIKSQKAIFEGMEKDYNAQLDSLALDFETADAARVEAETKRSELQELVIEELDKKGC